MDGRRLLFAGLVNDYLAFSDEVSADFKRRIDAFIAQHGLDAPPAQVIPVDAPDTRTAQRKVIEELEVKEAGITTIVWATGFHGDFGFLEVPVLDEVGQPKHRRGVSEVPGIYFIGLLWLYTRRSGFIFRPKNDAEYLVGVIKDRMTGVAR